MKQNTQEKETFEAFRKSFFYGSRSNLNFKFLEKLTDEEGYHFLEGLLSQVSAAMDDGDFGRVIDHVVDGQTQGYAEQQHFTYDSGPFTPLQKPLSDSRLVLLSSSGHFVEGDDPEPFGVKNMTQQEAMDRVQEFVKGHPQLSRIPKDTSAEHLRVRHGGYDIHGAENDANAVFPLSLLQELESEGVIGELADAFSFVGACAQTRLLKQIGPQWVQMMKEMQVDAALLVPV